MKKLLLICLLIPALAYSFTYKNNAQTGKPDMVTTSIADLTDIGTGYVPAATFASYTSIDRVPATRTVNGQALSSNVTVTTISGNAGTATALAANGTNCSATQASIGVDASGNSEGCWTPAGAYTLPTATSSILGGVKPDGTSILNTSGAISATAASVGAAALAGSSSQAFATAALAVTGYVSSNLNGGAVALNNGATEKAYFTHANYNLSDGTFAVLSTAGATDLVLGRNNSEKARCTADGLAVTGALAVSSVINIKNYTVSTLPAGTRGDIAYVTDALAPTFLTTIVGGGAVVAPVFFNGANWVGF